jgi:hypothetical protein
MTLDTPNDQSQEYSIGLVVSSDPEKISGVEFPTANAVRYVKIQFEFLKAISRQRKEGQCREGCLRFVSAMCLCDGCHSETKQGYGVVGPGEAERLAPMKASPESTERHDLLYEQVLCLSVWQCLEP